VRERESCRRQPKSRFLTIRPFGMTNFWGLSGALTRATVWPSVRGKTPTFGVHFAQPGTEDKKLRKELTLEVLALKVPFGSRVAIPNEVPWPGQLRTHILALNIRCRTMPRDATKYAGGHTSALGELFIADERKKAQGAICRSAKFISLVRRNPGRDAEQTTASRGREGSRQTRSSSCARMDNRGRLSPQKQLERIPRDEAARNDKSRRNKSKRI
jgi:hypothetical protein